MSNNLTIPLEPREDKKGNMFYIGRLETPISIDFTNGLTLLVFLSESGDEELQIAVNNKENSTFSKFTKKKNRLEIRLRAANDQNGKKFYIAKAQMNGYVRCHEEAVFLVFVSREKLEEVQIVGEIVSTNKKSSHREIEVIKKRSFSKE